MSSIPLTELPIGASGSLTPVDPDVAPLRLRELGFVAGTTVKVVRRGFLGDPVEIELRGYRICLRRQDLSHLRVVLQDSAA
jgi:ferrous iron transport protein A